MIKKRNLLWKLSCAAFIIGMALITHTFYGTGNTHIAHAQSSSFDDFNVWEDDPQAYTEYEKQQESAASNSSGGSAKLSGYTHAAKFSGYDVLKGIDVSVYQSDIKWKKVKNAGIDFAFIRVAYRGYSTGTILEDANYKTNIEGAIAAGVDVGVYIYSQATTINEAIEEARYTISLIKDYDINLPIVMDFEYASTSSGLGGRLYQANLTKAEATAVCNAFCQTVEANGYTGIVYANRSMLEAQVNASSISSQYDIWLANYTQKTSYKGDYSYWQYTSTGSVKGITGNVDRNFRYITSPSAPAALSVSASTYTSNTLSWSKVSGVYGYEIYRSDDAGATYTKIADVAGAGTTSYTDSALKPGTSSKYKIRAYYQLYDGNRYSAYTSDVDASTTILPEKTLITTDISETSVSLCWTETLNAAAYEIYRSSDGSEYTLLTTLPAGTASYTDVTLDFGTLYYYQLVITDSNNESCSSAPLLVTTLCPAPQNVTVSAYTKTSITLSWDACPYATNCCIATYDALTNSYQELITLPADTTSYKVTGLAANTIYEFLISCTIENESGITEGAGTPVTALTQSAAPKSFKASDTTKSVISLTWKKVDGVSGYEICRYDAEYDTFQRIKTITDPSKTTYKNKNLDAATGYSYQIRAYRLVDGIKYYGTFSQTLYAATAPAKVKSLKAKATATSIKLTWKKVSGATGYIVYRYDTKTKKYKKLKTVKTNSYTHKNLKKNTSFIYKVVAYKTYKGVKYTGATAKIKAKTKK